MNTVMDQAIERLRQLPAERAEQFARFVMHELDSNDAWDQSTESQAGNVDKLVAQITAEAARDGTDTLDPDRL